MSAATDEIGVYLMKCDDSSGNNHFKALLFARSMVEELRFVLQDWENAVKALEELKINATRELSN